MVGHDDPIRPHGHTAIPSGWMTNSSLPTYGRMAVWPYSTCRMAGSRACTHCPRPLRLPYDATSPPASRGGVRRGRTVLSSPRLSRLPPLPPPGHAYGPIECAYLTLLGYQEGRSPPDDDAVAVADIHTDDPATSEHLCTECPVLAPILETAWDSHRRPPYDVGEGLLKRDATRLGHIDRPLAHNSDSRPGPLSGSGKADALSSQDTQRSCLV